MQSDRFQIRRTVGQGGHGIVYEAFDNEREMTVALKTIRQASANDVYRLKREFRRLRDVRHPNLIQFYDLVANDEDCFYTMEYFPGVDLRNHCRPSERVCSLAETRAPDAEVAPKFEPTRVHHSLLQLAHALMWLHDAGFIHRDLKPSNVLVNAAGVLKVLDFGLALDLSGTHPDTRGHGIVGTLGYLSPEQAVGTTALTPATDWYSVGSILYELVTGELPFSGNVAQVLVAKQTRSPARIPEHYGAGVKHFEAWSELCLGLLRKKPEDRLSGRNILDTLEASTPEHGEQGGRQALATPSVKRHSFVGRAHEVAQIDAAFVATLDGQPTTVVIDGAAGMGKTQLVREWVKRTRQLHPDLCLLNGRCYDRDTVSFRALDTVVDELTRVWRGLPADQAAAIMPRNAHWLAEVFPVCRRVPAVERAPEQAFCHDPAERRSLALEALRETLTRLADRVPLVILIDDFHWADAESIRTLHEVLAPPEGPQVLLLLVQTSDADRHERDGDRGGQRRALAPSASFAPRDASSDASARSDGLSLGEKVVIEVGPLAFDESVRLLEDEIPQVDIATRLRLAGESQGIPETLVLICRLGGEEASAFGDITVAGLTIARLGELSDDSRRIVEVLALTTEPLPESVLREVTGLSPESFAHGSAWAADARFIHTTPDVDGLGVELHTPSTRDWILGTIDSASRRDYHARLAEALAPLSPPPFARIAYHYEQASDRSRAAEAEAKAGEQAAEQELLDRAAEHFLKAYRLGRAKDTALLARAGDYLAKAQRHLSAARCYAAVAEHVSVDDVAEARRCRLLATAHTLAAHAPHQAVRQAHEDLAAMKLDVPTREACRGFGARTTTGWYRMAAGRRLRDARATAQTGQASADARDPSKAEMLAAFAMAYAPLCLDRFEYFATRWLKAAAVEGNTALHTQARQAIAFADARRGKLCFQASLEKISQDTPQASRLIWITQAACHGAAGNFKDAYAAIAKISALAHEPEALAAAGTLADVQPIAVLVFSGDLNGAHRRLRSAIRRTRAREASAVRYLLELGVSSLLATAVDRVESIEHALDQIIRYAPPREYPTVDAFRYIASVELSLYTRERNDGWDALTDGHLDLDALSPVLRSTVRFARGRLLLVQAGQGAFPTATAHARTGPELHQLIAALSSEETPVARGFSALLSAGEAILVNNEDAARPALHEASKCFAESGAHLYVYLCDYLLVSLGEGRVQRSAELVQWSSTHQIAEPARFLAAMMPWPETYHATARAALAHDASVTLRHRVVDEATLTTSSERAIRRDASRPQTQPPPAFHQGPEASQSGEALLDDPFEPPTMIAPEQASGEIAGAVSGLRAPYEPEAPPTQEDPSRTADSSR